MSRCPICGGKIYRAADVCMSCGHACKRKKGSAWKWILFGAVAVALLAAVVWVLFW